MKGFGLIELMIALFVSAFLLIGAYRVVIGSQKVVRANASSTKALKLLEAPRRVLTDLIRKAGSDPRFTGAVPPLDIPQVDSTSQNEWATGAPMEAASTEVAATKVDVFSDETGGCAFPEDDPQFTPPSQRRIYVSDGSEEGIPRNWLVVRDMRAVSESNAVKLIAPNIVWFSLTPLNDKGDSLEVPWRNSGLGGNVDHRADVRSVEVEVWAWAPDSDAKPYSGFVPALLYFYSYDSNDNVWKKLDQPLLAPVYPDSLTSFVGAMGRLEQGRWKIDLVNNRYIGVNGREPCT